MNENGNGQKPPVPPRYCPPAGHHWIAAPPWGPAVRVCTRCPALGGPCPDCGDSGRYEPQPGILIRCTRCGGSGTVELVEITATEVQELRADRRRFRWLFAEHCYVIGLKPARPCSKSTS